MKHTDSATGRTLPVMLCGCAWLARAVAVGWVYAHGPWHVPPSESPSDVAGVACGCQCVGQYPACLEARGGVCATGQQDAYLRSPEYSARNSSVSPALPASTHTHSAVWGSCRMTHA
eukprot:jgi/Ulvmu1/10721/UM068_0006.1